MKIMFIVYHDIHTEARTQEILQCAKKIGITYFVSFSKPDNQEGVISLLTGNGIRNYRMFICDAIKYIRQIKPDVVILHDNYTAIILRWLLLHKKRPFIIYDSSELYIDTKPRRIKEYIAKIMQYYENKYLRYADVIIAANNERASIMKEYFKLEKMPLVFDNIHRIDDAYNKEECDNKFGILFKKNKFTAVYAGGISRDRMTYELADAFGKLGDDFSLIIIGNAREDEKVYFEKYIEEKGYKNVSYLGFISRAEFRYLLNRANISISAFSQDTINNKFCASGKVYESLFEGTPILVTENPPLKELCIKYHVGVSTDNFAEGLKELKENYTMYCEYVNNYIKKLNYNERIDKLTIALKEMIEGNKRC